MRENKRKKDFVSVCPTYMRCSSGAPDEIFNISPHQLLISLEELKAHRQVPVFEIIVHHGVIQNVRPNQTPLKEGVIRIGLCTIT